MWENTSKYNEKFIKNYDEDRDRGYILEEDFEYPKNLHDLHSDLPFLPERIRISKCNKLVSNLYDKNKCCTHNNTKTSTKPGTSIKKVHRVIKFNQEAWFKKYIDTNIKLWTEAKNGFENDFFKFMNNSGFGKTMENVRKHRVINNR